MPSKRLKEDDFVLTISDDEVGVSVEEEEEESSAPTPARNDLQAGKKRKREEESKKEVNGLRTNKKHKGKGKEIPEGAKKVEEEKDSVEEQQDWTTGGEDDGAIDSDFEFQLGDTNGVTEDFDGWGLEDSKHKATASGNKNGVDIDELVARRRSVKGDGPKEKIADEVNDEREDLEGVDEDFEDSDSFEDFKDVPEDDDELLAEDGFGMGATGEDEEEDVDADMEGGENDGSEGDSEGESVASPVAHPDDEASDNSSVEGDEVDDVEQAKREAFFAPEDKTVKNESGNGKVNSFQSMSLSRPILRGLASIGFSEPTPIQAKTIPVALLGKDVVGGAVTGSGKTAAFMIPILERLLYRPRKVPTSRVAILMPTRELAVQCFNVAKKLASFTDVSFCQLVGGFSLREQETALRSRPDVIIATPGRFIDHMRNSASFTVDTLEILVLDEADRMLEDGFADEVNEILSTIPKSRQTMLFSATMTSSVDKLISVGLNRPVRLMVDAQKQTVGTLTQEFVRLRPGREDKRLAYLLYLCTNLYTSRTIIFFRQKKEAHRVRVVFALCGFKAAELHGSMTQEQRIASVEAFRAGTATHLLATDVASRGLDIKAVDTVINYEAPQSHEIYLHRVGRTARAGRSGRACTIAAEPDRKVVKAAVKAGRAQGAKIVSRIVESDEADKWSKKLDEMEEEIQEVLKEEQEEKALSQVEMRIKKGDNLVKFEDEIMSRPKRTWFESEKEKRLAEKRGKEELNGPLPSKRKREGKLSNKDKKKLDDGRERREGKQWKKGKEDRGGKVTKKPNSNGGKGKKAGAGKPRGKPRR